MCLRPGPLCVSRARIEAAEHWLWGEVPQARSLLADAGGKRREAKY